MAVIASASISLSRVDDGATGATGKGVSKTEIYYYLSTSNTTQTDGSWVTTPPAWVDGRYYWQKLKTTFTDDSTSESNPVCITGGKGSIGSTGATGTGVSSITTEFYLSTSKTTQSGGSWSTTMPTWSSGKYLWTRSKIVYTNPSSTVYTTPYCDSSWEAVNEVEVGGRNLYIIRNSSEGYLIVEGTELNPMDDIRQEHTSEFIPVQSGEDYIFQVWVTIDSSDTNDPYLWMAYDFFNSDQTPIGNRPAQRINTTLPNGKSYGFYYITIPDGVSYLRVSARFYADGQIKLEKGNKATDWTPAPEDMATSGDISNIQESIDNASDRLLEAESYIKQLAESIVTLVTNEDGTTSMVQTSTGWTFSMDELNNNIGSAINDIGTLTESMGGVENTIDALTKSMADFGELTDYVSIGTYINESGDTKPCIDLGEIGGNFKVKITNEEIQFIDGSAIPTYISNQQMVIDKAKIESELQFGSFPWVLHNGNMGLTWKGDN